MSVMEPDTNPTNSRMGRRRKVVIAALVLLVVFPFVLNPLRLPSSVIEWYLIQGAPLGSDIGEVRQYVAQHGWHVAYDSEERGFLDQRSKPNRVVGSMSIRAELGQYQGLPFVGHITAFWGFDERGRLIDVWVWRTRDAL
ncbi:hypothetical protein ACGF5M_04660 [Gemmatimonadota bacterium]